MMKRKEDERYLIDFSKCNNNSVLRSPDEARLTAQLDPVVEPRNLTKLQGQAFLLLLFSSPRLSGEREDAFG